MIAINVNYAVRQSGTKEYRMILTDVIQHFRQQIELANPTTQEQIDTMVERRRNTNDIKLGEITALLPAYTEEQLQHIASKVGVKQLFFITRTPGKVEILKVWEDELGTLTEILDGFSYYATSTNHMPEFIRREE
jgi:hypothetical protein